MENYSETRLKILEIGKAEFLEHGYKDASLRQIVAKAGFTKGAFYGYYKDKASLFYDLTDPCANAFLDSFKNAQSTFFDLVGTDETANSNLRSTQFLFGLVEYVYDNHDAFKLILCKSAGTKYENFVHDLVELQVDKTLLYHEQLKKLGKLKGDIDRDLFHILTSAYHESLFEIIRHDIKKEDALRYIEKISNFFTAGFETVIKYL